MAQIQRKKTRDIIKKGEKNYILEKQKYVAVVIIQPLWIILENYILDNYLVHYNAKWVFFFCFLFICGFFFATWKTNLIEIARNNLCEYLRNLAKGNKCCSLNPETTSYFLTWKVRNINKIVIQYSWACGEVLIE